MKDLLANQFIFMTGATSGLGKISALKAANDGAKVIVLARSREKGQLLIDEYKNQHPNGLGEFDIIEGNLSSFDSIVKACDEVHS